MNHPAILQLEDDDNDVMFLRFAFKAAQIPNPLLTVRDGQEAVDYFSGTGQFADRARFPIPIVALLDLKTPRLSGQEVLKWIRAQRAFRSLVCIILSASGNQHDVNAAYAEGANAYLVKPAGLDKLTEQVRALQIFWLGHNKFAGQVDFTL